MLESAEQLSPYALTCEALTTPLGVGKASPRFSWKLSSSLRGDKQTAYRLRVALSEEDLSDPQRVLWDTGRVESAENLHTPYDGPPLTSSTRYFWSVLLWDVEGRAVGESRTWFETAIMHSDEWQAAWIGRGHSTAGVMAVPRQDDRTPTNRHLEPPPHLRRVFELSAAPVRARLYATARGVYELRLNGVRVGDQELAPGWTEYRHRILYQTYDVTELVVAGGNVLGAVLADGWWSGFIGFDARRAALHYGDAPQMLAQLVVDFANGSRQVIATDEAWREQRGAIIFADALHGEFVDAGHDLGSWDRYGYDDSGWLPAAVLDDDVSMLVPTPDHPVRVVAELPTLSLNSVGANCWIADLGQNMVGRVRLTLRDAPAGQRIRLRHGEMLNADGTLYVDNLRTAEATDGYVTGGKSVEVFEPKFTFHGFRYVEISGVPYPPLPADIVGRVLSTDLPPVGEFSCSDATVMQLDSNIRWAQRGNFVSIPTDCPQRNERLGWLADAQIFLPTACRTADVSAFFARWMCDVIDGQDDDGAFGDVAPRLRIECIDREGAPAWGDAGVIIPWHLYRTYGDLSVLRESFDAMVAWVDHIHRHNPNLVWRNQTGNSYGDWLEVNARTSPDMLATAYFARSTQLVALAAAALDRFDEAKKYSELHAGIRAAFVTAFVDDDGRVEGDTQTGYLLALAFDLLPSHLVASALGHLVADIESRGRHLTTGFVGAPLLCSVLTEHGRSDLAFALLHQDTYPSWGYSIAQGATTIWERWDGWTKENGFQSATMNSFNHYSLGSVADWLHGRVAGIEQAPDSVAYRQLVFRPTVGGRLDWAAARYESPRGQVACGWRLAGGDLQLTVTVPPGSSALLHLPTSHPDTVLVDGVAIRNSDVTVRDVLEEGRMEIALRSGSYQILTRYEVRP